MPGRFKINYETEDRSYQAFMMRIFQFEMKWHISCIVNDYWNLFNQEEKKHVSDKQSAVKNDGLKFVDLYCVQVCIEIVMTVRFLLRQKSTRLMRGPVLKSYTSCLKS